MTETFRISIEKNWVVLLVILLGSGGNLLYTSNAASDRFTGVQGDVLTQRIEAVEQNVSKLTDKFDKVTNRLAHLPPADLVADVAILKNQTKELKEDVSEIKDIVKNLNNNIVLRHGIPQFRPQKRGPN